MTLEMSKDLGRFSRELELGVFRILQECLTNIHRHSNSPTAQIVLAISNRQLRVRVEHQGKGMDSSDAGAKSPGVGLNGIRERIAQLHGQMKIRSSESGTIVEALFPLEEKAADA